MTDHRGKWVVSLIFVIGLAMGSYAWWHIFQRGRRSLALWGSQAAVAVRDAAEVELLMLSPAEAAAAGTLNIDGREYEVIARSDVRRTPGLVHARHSLLEDANFVWTDRGTNCTPRWEFALVFLEADQQATLVFDPDCQQVRLLETGRTGRLEPWLSRALAMRVRQWSSAPSPAP